MQENIHLIIIGNELLNGKIKDTNTQWLANFLFQRNIKLTGMTIVQDDPVHFKDTLKYQLQHNKIVLTTGGLGPTKDDLTKAMLADFFQKEICFQQSALDITTQHFVRGQREDEIQNMDYMNIPKDFVPFYNPVGFAPGLGHITQEKKLIASMPGVPDEFQTMFSESIFPWIEKNVEHAHTLKKHLVYKTKGLKEAHIFQKIEPTLWDKLAPYGIVSSLPHKISVDIGIEVQGENQKELEQKESEIDSLIYASKLKDAIWHKGSEDLLEVIVKEAKEKNLTFGFSESCTGGLCSDRITNVSGSSEVFKGSVICYSNEVKHQLLKVSQEILKTQGAVSSESAMQMARGGIQAIGSDICLSITGIAGPGGGSEEKPVGTAFLGLYNKKTQSHTVKKIYRRGTREYLKFIFSQICFFELLEEIRRC